MKIVDILFLNNHPGFPQPGTVEDICGGREGG